MRRITASLPVVATALTAAAAVVLSGPVTDSTAPASTDLVVVGEAIGATPPGRTAPATADNSCTDTAYTVNKWHLAGTYTWSYNANGAPAAVAGTALDAIQRGTQTAVTGANRCGTTVTLPIRHSYAGTESTRVAQVSPSGTCTGNDGRSVTSWGPLPAGYLAYTCVYYSTSTGKVLASDMLLSTSHNWFTTMPANCTNGYDLESTVVHERGHTIGLSHVDQATHSLQTMSPSIQPCTTFKRLLGAGDLAGIQRVATP